MRKARADEIMNVRHTLREDLPEAPDDFLDKWAKYIYETFIEQAVNLDDVTPRN
jgi:hypothetical protein